MEKYLNKVLIVDGSYMLHRALHAPALDKLVTSTGVKSGGVFGFLRILQAEIKKCSGYFPIVCWDKGLSERRLQLYPNYKHNLDRQEADALIASGVAGEEDDYLYEYHRQRSDLILILKSLGIPSIIIPGYEGDDLQYLISNATDDGIILTDDRDLIQLVSPTIKIRRPMKDEWITWEDSDPYYRHPRFTIMKSITGDGSDNIPQVAAGLGSKGADAIACLWDSSDTMESFKEKVRTTITDMSRPKRMRDNCQKLIDNWTQFEINYGLINLRLVVPEPGLEFMIKDLISGVVGKSNLMSAYKLIGAYEMETIFPDQIIFSLSVASNNLFKKSST